MEKEVLGYCPVCNEKLVATKLSCKNCNLDMVGDFSLNKFSYLTKEEQEYVALFLQNEGSFKDVQEAMDITYQKAKQMLSAILVKLGLRSVGEEGVEMKGSEGTKSFLKVNEEDHFVTKLIKEKLNQNGGHATIPLITSGKQARIWFDPSGEGLACDKIPVPNQLTWGVFVAAYNIAVAQDGELYKGYARTGKLGSDKLPVNSLEGYIAYEVHGVAEGESAYSPGFIIAAVLDWVGILINERGSTLKVVEKNVFISTYEEALANAKTFLNGIGDSQAIQSKLNFFRHWYYFEEIDGFAPSKFIGYRSMDIKAYEVSHSSELDGRDTERTLKNIFKLADDVEKEKLLPKLTAFLGKFDKQPNVNAQIHVK
jgi:hypothetical protein